MKGIAEKGSAEKGCNPILHKKSVASKREIPKRDATLYYIRRVSHLKRGIPKRDATLYYIRRVSHPN